MNYVMFNHHGKGDAYKKELDKKHVNIRCMKELYQNVDFVLTDQIIYGRMRKLAEMRSAGVKRFFVYPHSARPNLINDIEPLWPHTSGEFVSAYGHKEIMRSYGHNRPIHIVGWSLCEMREFQPRKSARKVLFAPIHPRCDEIDCKLNLDVYKILEKLAETDQISLTVRYIKSLNESGLRNVSDHPNIRYTEGHLIPSTYQIDKADVVVSHQTFAYLAVARGVPTVMMGEDMPTHLIPLRYGPQFAKHWDLYKDMLMYPLDIMDAKNPMDMLQNATQSDVDISEWRERMIGKTFDHKEFSMIIESYF